MLRNVQGEMADNATETPSNDNGTDFTSPVSILPLAISLATLVVIIVAGCVLYRRCQRRRALELERQLKVTERRIYAIGTLTAKKEQELEARKAEYQAPMNAKCSSLSSLEPFEADTLRSSRKRGEMLGMEIQSEEEEADPGNFYYTNESAVLDRSTAIVVPVSVIDEGASSYYCSTCPEGGSAVGSVMAQSYTNRNAIDSSMVVECETIPSVSSLSTIHTGPRSVLNPKRSRSEGHSLSIRVQQQQQRGTARYNPTSTRPLGRRTTHYLPAIHDLPSHSAWRNTLSSSNEDPSQPISTAYMGITPLYHSALSAMGLPEEVNRGGEGRPNTPVTSTCTSENSTGPSDDTDGQREKWV